MSALRALWFAWGAVVALLAYPAHAQVIGQESAILGGEDGFFRPTIGGGESTVTIDAMPYTRTVTCDTITVTGTYTGTAPTGWSASPSGDTGSCTDLGGGTFSCVVDVDPDASGEGVETITIGNDSVDIGFYVAGSHSCFLAQSVDGSYNSTLADSDPVATWENLGSSALDVTQGTAANQPTFKTSIVGGNPVVRCDGGDSLGAATASDWNFMNDGTDYTIGSVFINNSTNYTISSTRTSNVDGFVLAGTSTTPRFEIDDGALVVVVVAAVSTMTSGSWHSQVAALDDDGSTGDDAFLYLDGALHATGAAITAYPASAGRSLVIGIGRLVGGSAVALTGDLFRVIIYQSALTSTQRAINQAVDEWALGGTLPVTTPTVHVDASDLSSITSPDAPVTAWINTVDPPDTFIEATNPPTHSGTGASAQVDFDGANDKLEDSTFIWSRSPTAWHIIAVVTPDAVDTNGTGANCYLNDPVINDGGPYRGLFFRNSGGVDYAIAYNWDGTADCAETPITVGQRQVLDASLSGGDVRIGVNGGALTSTPSGATTVSPASVQIGKNKSGSQFFDGKVHEIYFVPAALSAVDRANLVDSLMQKWEVTP